MCSAYIDARTTAEPNCTFPNCKYSHDVKTYLEKKEPDVGESVLFVMLSVCVMHFYLSLKGLCIKIFFTIWVSGRKRRKIGHALN